MMSEQHIVSLDSFFVLKKIYWEWCAIHNEIFKTILGVQTIIFFHLFCYEILVIYGKLEKY